MACRFPVDHTISRRAGLKSTAWRQYNNFPGVVGKGQDLRNGVARIRPLHYETYLIRVCSAEIAASHVA